jgi:hypothetical protein
MADVAILTSGMALGHYIPALNLHRRLRAAGTRSKVYVFERYKSADAQRKILASRDVFQSSFRKALIARKLHGVLDAVDLCPTESFLAEWSSRDIGTFVVMSGQWCEYVAQFCRGRRPIPRIELLHIDSVDSPSWAAARRAAERLTDIGAAHTWLISHAGNAIRAHIAPGAHPSVAWAKRRKKVVAHGGGWSVGTFQTLIPRIASAGIEVFALLGSQPRPTEITRNVIYFSTRRDWVPWLAPCRSPFPPVESVQATVPPGFRRGRTHAALALARDAIAIVSKPGGSTLLDSLGAATPLILLEPWGEHEAKNAKLWIDRGLGVSFDDWAASGFSLDVLEGIHENLVEMRGNVADYAEELLAREA